MRCHRERSVAIHDFKLHGLPRFAFHEQLHPCLSLRAPTRNPWLAWHWIPGRARDDSYRVRDDNFGFKARVRNLAGFWKLAMTTL